MNNRKVTDMFEQALESLLSKLQGNKKCQAIILYGSMSHDRVTEHSDLSLLAIFSETYKGPRNQYLIEYDVRVNLMLWTVNEFRDFLKKADCQHYLFCALSKAKILYSTLEGLQDMLEESLYIGKKDSQLKMLLSFSSAVYNLEKAEKNTLYFCTHIPEEIALIVIARQQLIPEREIIKQAKLYEPDIFDAVYTPLFKNTVTYQLLDDILQQTVRFLEECTESIYRPVLDHLMKNGNLDDFYVPKNNHGYGINLNWLIRVGLAEQYITPIQIDNQKELYYRLSYRLKNNC